MGAFPGRSKENKIMGGGIDSLKQRWKANGIFRPGE